ncbi:hypothetical protein [Kitasatospora terrestris]|uniref:Uncharacterized protein n=1 Tax=Kitasatospora terrestris TaxID=258051 RepID=A0ABP9ELL8_9ACTN
MRDPLEWRGGDGPLEDWLGGIEEQLVGRPGAYALWGRRTEEHVYGELLGSGLGRAELARRLAGLGADGVHVRTSAGLRHGEPRLELAPLGEPSRPDRAFEFVSLDGAPAGPVPLYGTVRTPTELAAWLAAWSPLLPGGLPEAGWSPRSYTEPMAVAFQHRLDSSQLLLTPLARAERGGNVSIRMLLQAARAELGRDLLLLRSPRMLEEPRPGSYRELREWLDRVGALWGAAPLPVPGLREEAGRVAHRPTLTINKIIDGAPEMLVHRHGLPLLTIGGPAADLGGWGALLQEPAVLSGAALGSRRGVTRWLEQVEHALWGRPAVWTVRGEPAPLDTPALAHRLTGRGAGGDLHLDRVHRGRPGPDAVAPTTAALGGTGTTGVTGR